MTKCRGELKLQVSAWRGAKCCVALLVTQSAVSLSQVFTHHLQFHRYDPHEALFPVCDPSDPNDWYHSQSHTSWNQTHTHLQWWKNRNTIFISSVFWHLVSIRAGSCVHTLITANPLFHCNVINSDKSSVACVSVAREHYLKMSEDT